MGDRRSKKRKNDNVFDLLFGMLIAEGTASSELVCTQSFSQWQFPLVACILIQMSKLPRRKLPPLRDALLEAWEMWGPKGRDAMVVQESLEELANHYDISLPTDEGEPE